MSKFTNVKKWAQEKGYKVEEIHPTYMNDTMKLKVIINPQNHFICETRDSTIYMSIRGQKGNAGGLYVTLERKPSDGRFIRGYAMHQRSQKEMIESMESDIKNLLVD